MLDRTFFIAALVAVMAITVPAGAFDPPIIIPAGDSDGEKSRKVRGSGSRRAASDGLAPYRHLGAWIDMFDKGPWVNPEGAVRRMARKGVTTLYLQTSNYSKKKDLYRPQRLSRFVRAAHGEDIAVVSWYVPDFKNLGRDLRRSMKAIRFRAGEGHRFDSFALDVEATVVGDIETRNRRYSRLARRIRNKVGGDYTLGAIVPEAGASYWPGFPYRETARRFDVFLPMAYYTYRVKGRKAVRSYITNNVTQIRDRTGRPRMPVHPIGGLGGDGTNKEAGAYVRATRRSNAIGGSFYDFPITRKGEWRALQRLAR